jgi:hypothetical protein
LKTKKQSEKVARRNEVIEHDFWTSGVAETSAFSGRLRQMVEGEGRVVKVIFAITCNDATMTRRRVTSAFD